MTDMIIQIPDKFDTPLAEHDVWNAVQIELNEENRRRALRFMAGAHTIEQLIAANNEAQLEAHKPARWNV